MHHWVLDAEPSKTMLAAVLVVPTAAAADSKRTNAGSHLASEATLGATDGLVV
jgi:hypothetical protein